MWGLAPRLPITITLLTDMTTNLLARLRPLPVIGQDALCFHHRANLFPRGPCIWRKAHSEHLSPRPLTKFGGRGKDAGWGDGWVKISGCEAATICGGRPGLFPLANDADRGEPQLNGDGEVNEWRGAGCQ